MVTFSILFKTCHCVSFPRLNAQVFLRELMSNPIRMLDVSVSVYLFAIENYMNSSKKKSNYLDSHGEEAQKKLAGL